MMTFTCGGFCSFNHQTVPYITSAGTTQLDHVTCTGPVKTAGSLFAQNCHLERVKSAGSSVLEKTKVKDLKGNGSTRLIGCTIETVKTAGDLQLEHSTIGELAHTGHLRIDGSMIQKSVCHAGKIEVNNSKIQNTLKTSSEDIKVHDSQIKTILVRPQQNSSLKIFGFTLFSSSVSPKTQTVKLTGRNCTIGSIIFEKGCNGQVVQKDGAEVKTILHNSDSCIE